MSRLFKHRITDAGRAAMLDVIHVGAQDVQQAKKTHGDESVEVANSLHVLASIHYVVEDYEEAESLLLDYLQIMKKRRGAESPEVQQGLILLMNTYMGQMELEKMYATAAELKPGLEGLAESGVLKHMNDLLIESLIRLAVDHRDSNDPLARQRGFIFAFMALSWCITSYGSGSTVRSRMLPQLRKLIMAFGIGKHDYAWILRRCHQTENDIVGLLSVIDEEGVFKLADTLSNNYSTRLGA